MKKILLLAPQPFYTERGTPIAVLNLSHALIESGYVVDILTFPHGEDIAIGGLTIHRVGKWLPLPKKLPVGFSFRKLILDFIMLFKAVSLCRHHDYIALHGVEEAAFIALAARKLSRSPNNIKPRVIYDMDSSMSDQLVERWPSLSIVHHLFDGFEGYAVRHVDQILAVCQALKDKCEQHTGHAPVTVIEDISDNRSPNQQNNTAENEVDDLTKVLPHLQKKILYVGNLEHYQGVGLVLEAMAEKTTPSEIGFIIIGGQADDIARYQQLADQLGISDKVAFLGPRPVGHLNAYLAQADILASPRLKGVNTPMKIYTYLGAGKPILATKIASHTQVLNEKNALLAEPNAAAMATGLATLYQDQALASNLAEQAQQDAQAKYSYARFKVRIAEFYQTLLA